MTVNICRGKSAIYFMLYFKKTAIPTYIWLFYKSTLMRRSCFVVLHAKQLETFSISQNIYASMLKWLKWINPLHLHLILLSLWCQIFLPQINLTYERCNYDWNNPSFKTNPERKLKKAIDGSEFVQLVFLPRAAI